MEIPPPAPLFGKERDAGFADVFDITVDGAARHAEFFREIRRGNSAFLLNGRNDADEAVGFQIKAPFYPQYSTPMWKTKRKTCNANENVV